MTDLYPPRHYTYDDGRRGVELPANELRIEEAPRPYQGLDLYTEDGLVYHLKDSYVQATLDLALHYFLRKDPA